MSNVKQTRWIARLRGVILGLLVAVPCLMPAPAAAQNSAPALGTRNEHELTINIPTSGNNLTPDKDPLRSLSTKQKQSIVQANFLKSKNDAAELAALAKELCKELDKPNADVLSLEVVNRVERIEKLAKKIRDETKGF